MPSRSAGNPAQKNFMSLMAQINRQWRRAIDRKLRPFGLTEALWLPLLHLSRASEPMRQKDLAASLALDSSSVVRLLDGLQLEGLIERLEGADRRAKTIHLTERGLETIAMVENVVGQARSDMFVDVPRAELDAAFSVLQRIARTLEPVEEEALS